jgi:CubicO group peptidase (beta-lactamase class C family)
MRKGRALLAVTLAALAASADSQRAGDPVTDPFFAADQGDTRAVMILNDGRIVAKRYQPGYSDRNRFISWSMNKTITGMLVGELVDDGRLTLDAPAPVAEWRAKPGDPRAAITLRQLLQMSSGLRHTEVGDPLWDSDTNQTEFVTGAARMAADAIAQPLEARPGEKYEYSTLTSILLSEIVTRALTDSRDPRVRAEAYRRFAEERLFRPAGVRSAFLEFDGAGTQVGGSLVHISLPDWARLGTVLLDGRGPDGRTAIISPGWLAFMKTRSGTNGNYGGQTWLNRPDATEGVVYRGAPATVASMEGHLGQHVVASPDSGTGRGVVIVRLGNTLDREVKRNWEVIGDTLARRFRRPGA